MADTKQSARVLPHGSLEVLADNLWRVEGELPRIPIRRVMTLVKLADGALLIHNAILLEEGLMARIEAWAKPTWLVVPNGGHRMDAPAMKLRYPDLKVLCPIGARKRVEEVVAVDGTYEDFPPNDVASFENLDGCSGSEGVLKVRSKEGTTLVFNDALFNVPPQPGLKGFVLKVIGSSGGPKVTPVAKMIYIKDKPAFAAHLQRLAQTPDLVRVIVSHYQMITENPRATLQTVAQSL